MGKARWRAPLKGGPERKCILIAARSGKIGDGKIFVFDVAGPDRVPGTLPASFWKEGADWSIHVEVDGNSHSRWMTRKIVCFRKNAAGRYRRTEELHRLRLFHPAEVAAELDTIGFRATVKPGYGRFRLYPGMHAIVARKR